MGRGEGGRRVMVCRVAAKSPLKGAPLPGRVRVWGLGSGCSIVVLARGQGAWIPAGAGMTN